MDIFVFFYSLFFVYFFRHLGIKPEFRKYLGIHIIEEDGSISYYVWRVMFLGIADAVFIFTAILKPIRTYIASLGIPNLLYLDDHLTGGPTREKAIHNNEISNQVLSNAGFVVSKEKKNGPLQRILFLGLEVCSVTLKFFIPEKKIIRLLSGIDSLLSSSKVKLRILASFLGLLQSCIKAIGPVTRLMTRCSYLFLMSNVDRYSWNYYLPLSDDVKNELMFWQSNIVNLNGFRFRADLSMIDIHHEIVTDASKIGIFGYRFSASEYEIVLRRLLSETEKKRSSTHRELLALFEIYATDTAFQFANKIVRHSADNQALVAILDHGSRVKELHDMAVAIFLNCRRLNIHLFIEWKPREHPLLVHADWGSRIFDQSSYSLNAESFSAMVEFFQTPLEFDLMADYWNRKCDKYFSRFPDPCSAGVNVFSQKLDVGVFYYCFPPPSLFTAVVLHLAKFQVSGLLLVPVWKAAAFWNNVVPDGSHLPSWVKKFLIFRPTGFVVDPNVISHTFKCQPVSFDVIVLYFDFRSSNWENIFESFKIAENCILYGCQTCLN